MPSLVAEYRDTLEAADLRKLPNIMIEFPPIWVSTHMMADQDWAVRIISQRKKVRYRSGHSDKTRICFHPSKVCDGNKHSTIHLKFPFFAETAQDVFLKMVEKIDEAGNANWAASIGLRLNLFKTGSRWKEEVLDNLISQWSMTEILEAYNRRDEAEYPRKKKAAPQPPPIDNVIDFLKALEQKEPKYRPPISTGEIDKLRKALGV